MSRALGLVIGAASLAALGPAASPTLARGAGEGIERRLEIHRLHGGAYLGVRLGDVGRDDLARLKLEEERGAVVTDVEKGTPAEKAGLREGDVILSYQGEAVRSAAHLARLVRETPGGRTVALAVSREGTVQELSATLGEGRRVFRLEGDFDTTVPPLPPLPPESFRFEDRDRGHRLVWRDRGRGPRRLGIEYQEISGQLAHYFRLSEEEGVLVTSVDAGSPAARAGIKAGDVILKLAGKAVRDGGDLRDALADADPGQEVAVTVQREGKPLDLKVRIGGREPQPEQGA